jgi:anthranilate/para-aminobenzoate synthase component II
VGAAHELVVENVTSETYMVRRYGVQVYWQVQCLEQIYVSFQLSEHHFFQSAHLPGPDKPSYVNIMQNVIRPTQNALRVHVDSSNQHRWASR